MSDEHSKAGPVIPVTDEMLADFDRAWSTVDLPPLGLRARVRNWTEDQADRFRAAWRAFRHPHDY